MAMLNADQAVDNLMVAYKLETLRDLVYNCYKDQYGALGYHVMGYEKPELVSWVLNHYYWDEPTQKWTTKFPLNEDNVVQETLH